MNSLHNNKVVLNNGRIVHRFIVMLTIRVGAVNLDTRGRVRWDANHGQCKNQGEGQAKELKRVEWRLVTQEDAGSVEGEVSERREHGEVSSGRGRCWL